MNWNSVHICKSRSIKKTRNKAKDIVNNSLAHWIKETEKQNSELLLKHMPKDALETFENVLLYIRKRLKYQLTKTEDCTITRPLQIYHTAI